MLEMFEVFPGYNATPMTELAMQLPMHGYGTPFALDWNDDGVLDLWHHNHYEFSNDPVRWSDPSTHRYGPMNKAIGGCFVDWDAVLRDPVTGTWYAANEGHGFLDWDDERRNSCFDIHSTMFVDIDGDGYKDLFLTTGGGRGTGSKAEYDNVIFWGVEANSTLGYKLVGGRDAASAAGVEGRTRGNINERGRHHYWLDVDGDGELDFISLNEERTDAKVIPGQLNRNIGGRKFAKIPNVYDDFASVALLADVDCDGFAREFISMSECHDPPFNGNNNICKRAPRGTATVYSLDPKKYLVRETIYTPPVIKEFARTVATGDFDNDGIADIAVLVSKEVRFHLSRRRKVKCSKYINPVNRRKCLLTLGVHNAVLDVGTYCGRQFGSAGLRLADFNLDGRLDMLVVCKTPGRHVILEQMPNGNWTRMTDSDGKGISLGPVSSPDLMLGPKDFCTGIPLVPGELKANAKCHKKFPPEMCTKVRYKIQFQLCSRYARAKKEPNAWSLGATVADIDNDGYVDVIISHKFGSTVMFRNTLGDSQNNRFIVVRLDRTAGAAASIGAIVKLTAARMGPNQNRPTTQLRVLSSLSHVADPAGGNEDRIIFGLGGAGIPKRLTVQWPHCCKPTIIGEGKLKPFLNSMDTPYEVPAPQTCDKSCFK